MGISDNKSVFLYYGTMVQQAHCVDVLVILPTLYPIFV